MSLKFPLNPLANEHVGRGCQWNCDSEKDCSRKGWKEIEQFKLRMSGSADVCYQLKAYRKTDVIIKK